ncbi:hypothetical protein LguiA_007560 [Lonicera macranthoides]
MRRDSCIILKERFLLSNLWNKSVGWFYLYQQLLTVNPPLINRIFEPTFTILPF